MGPDSHPDLWTVRECRTRRRAGGRVSVKDHSRDTKAEALQLCRHLLNNMDGNPQITRDGHTYIVSGGGR